MKYRRSILSRSSVPLRPLRLPAPCGIPICPPLATTAANPAFSCRCGSPGTGRPLREVHPGALRSSAPCHNGSGTRIFLPLRKPRNRPTPATGTSRAILVLRPLPQRQRNWHFPAVAEAPEPTDPCERHFPGLPGPPPHSTTAAEPVFSCRCGSPGTDRPLREVLPGPPRYSAPCHNGSGTGIFLPLWKYGTYILSLYILGVRQYAENE